MIPLLVRVDSRLIHGTIVEAWVNHLKANTIIVANDEIMDNGLQLAVLELAVPPPLKFGIYSLKVATQKLIDGDFDEKKDRIILLFSSIKDTYKAISYGLKISSLNLGDFHSVNGTIKLSDRVVIGEDDLELLKKMAMKGISVFVQCLPRSHASSLEKLLTYKK